jgi:Mn2+/Fe2+ NRAMP family transporter
VNAPEIKDPPRSLGGILLSIGPGLILTANIVGTGELIATTKLGSEAGFTLLWFILFACFIKVFVQVELGRYALAEGVGSLEILNRFPGPRLGVKWVVWFWFLMYIGTLCQMAGMVGGVARIFAPKTPWGPHAAWAAATALSCALMLVAGRYSLVEKGSTIMVVLFTLTNLVAAALLQRTSFAVGAGDVAQGFAFGLPPDLGTAFVVFGITGVGAAELMFYPIWCLEKGYAKACGPRDGTPEWSERARGWMRVMRWDAWCSMVVYTVGTVCFYLLGAAILHRKNLPIKDGQDPIARLMTMYTETFGAWGEWIFLVGACMVLYSTYFVSMASNARLFVDLGGLLRLFRPSSPEERMKLVRGAIAGIAVFTLALYLTVGEPVKLVVIGGTAQALMLPFLGWAALRGRAQVPPELRAGPAWTAWLFTSFAAMAVLGVYQMGDKSGLWKALGLFGK